MDEISGKWLQMAEKTANKKETLTDISDKQSETRKKFVKISDLKTEEKFEKYIRKHTEEEFEALSKAIAQDGKIRDPLTVQEIKGERKFLVIDGHHRLKIARNLVESGRFEFEQLAVNVEVFENEQEIFIWMLRHQLGRRNLTPFERAEIGFRITGFLEELALDKKKHKEVDNKLLSKWIKAPEVDKIDYAEVVSEVTGVPRTTIIRAKKLYYNSNEELKSKVRSGDISISKAYQNIVDFEKEQKQSAKVKKRQKDFQHTPFTIKELTKFINPDSLLKWVNFKKKPSTNISVIQKDTSSILYTIVDKNEIVYVRIIYNMSYQENTVAHYQFYILNENSEHFVREEDGLGLISPDGKLKVVRKCNKPIKLSETEELALLRNVVRSGL